MDNIVDRMHAVLEQLKQDDPVAYSLVDERWPHPAVYRGAGPIRLIVLGQDPTVNNPAIMHTIKTVLNLDKHGPLRNYIKGITNRLGLTFDSHLYGTNLYKNFFTKPPVQLKKSEAPDVFERFRSVWLEFLIEELSEFEDVPVITLGEPLLQALALPGASSLVREYWGYTKEWKTGGKGDFSHLPGASNRLGRKIFPFPHNTAAHAKRFYSDRLRPYTAYVGQDSGIVPG